MACYAFPEQRCRRIRSTNALERLNQELVRRTRVVPILPNSDACLRLLSALCPELSYEGMDVSNGTEAMAVWEDVIFGRSGRRADPAGQLASLRQYCERDTIAMVRIHEVLREALA